MYSGIWNLELNIKPGKFDDFKTLMEEMSVATKTNEPGALNYEWFVNADNTVCHIYERYVDSNAVMTHMGNFQNFADRFWDALEATRFMVYGPASDQVKEALGGAGASFMEGIGGFVR